MIEFTLQVPNELAERLQPLGPWLPTALELSLLRFRTRSAATASEVLDFLATNPTPQAVVDYHVSEESQARLRRLLALSSEGLLAEEEQHELDELERLEHILVMLKAALSAR